MFRLRGLWGKARKGFFVSETVERDQHVYPIPVVCALIIQDGMVLLERHAPSYGYADPFWDIPGGKLECGETPEQAVVREIREEMAIEIEVIRLLPRLDVSVWIDKHWLLATYECRIVFGAPPLSDELAWLAIDQLSRYDVKTPDLEIIRAATAAVISRGMK